MTQITIRIEESARQHPRPPSKNIRRRTVSVPLSDTSVDQWWDAQHNPSASVRRLIREHIATHGFDDVDNRPVAPRTVESEPINSGTPVIVIDKATGEAQHYTLGHLSFDDPEQREVLEAIVTAQIP